MMNYYVCYFLFLSWSATRCMRAVVFLHVDESIRVCRQQNLKHTLASQCLARHHQWQVTLVRPHSQCTFKQASPDTSQSGLEVWLRTANGVAVLHHCWVPALHLDLAPPRSESHPAMEQQLGRQRARASHHCCSSCEALQHMLCTRGRRISIGAPTRQAM